MRRLLTLVILVVLAPAAAADVSGPEIVGFLNAQRDAHGIPAGIAEDAGLSDGCAKHNHYMALNGITHTEQEDAPGYTPEGAQAGATSVLYQGDHWTGERNPFETAPIHLHQLLAPRIDTMGAFESEGYGCATTQASQNRPAPAGDVTYTYPRDGAAGWRTSEVASEGPYTPGEKLGLPAGTETGPYLYVLFDGPDLTPGQPATQASATLTGPDGPVDVLVADNETDGLEGYLPTGAELIPRSPLAPGTTYTASVSATVAGRGFSHTWSFTTGARENFISIDSIDADSNRHIVGLITSTAPGGTLTLTGPGTPVTVPINDSGPTGADVDADGDWTACARSGGGTSGYQPYETCLTFLVAGAPAPVDFGPDDIVEPAPTKPHKPFYVYLTHKGPKVTVTIEANRRLTFKGVLRSSNGDRVRLRKRPVLAGRSIGYLYAFARGVKRVKLRGVVRYAGKRRVVKRRLSF